MPPPTASDPWLAGRRFGIVIDAGSSGSRLQIYSWKDPRITSLDDRLLGSLPEVEKGVREGEGWVSKVEPGISTFVENPEGVAAYLAPLLEHARSHVPPSLQPETPLFLLATAGMRLLTPEHQGEILLQTCKFLKYHSNFRIDERSPSGPCGSSVRIITGEEEGLFGWIAVNYLMDGFMTKNNDRTTYGFLDMGGASTQIAFEPSKDDRRDSQNLINVRLRRLGGEEIKHEVFVTTWLGYGTNQARERYVGEAINRYERARPEGLPHGPSTAGEIILDPCLPKNLELVETPMHLDPAPSHNQKSHTLLGTGSFEQCLQTTSVLLNKDAPCSASPCLFNGVHVPPIDFSVSHFIGVSEYWYSSEHIFGLGGPYDFVQYERAASAFCSRDWPSLIREHQESRQHGRLGGDGEVETAGHVVGTGKWGSQVELPRLQMQCFKAAWIVNVLHEGIGMPRIVDPGGNETTEGDKIAQQAQRKGLGRPTFQSLDTVGNIAFSWTLGKMVLEASKEVPLLSASDRPLADPLDDTFERPDSPIKPIRPPFLDISILEDRISYHLPSLSKTSLGFSPVLFILYCVIICAIITLTYRVRRHLRVLFRRSIRGAFKRDDYTYFMEEGKAGASRPPSPRSWFLPVQKLFSHRPRLPPLNTVARPAHTSSTRSSPIRSLSLPTMNGFATNPSSRSSSPSPKFGGGSGSCNGGDDTISRSISSLSSMTRSRNSSQLNLTTLVPRQPAAISRANSKLYEESLSETEMIQHLRS